MNGDKLIAEVNQILLEGSSIDEVKAWLKDQNHRMNTFFRNVENCENVIENAAKRAKDSTTKIEIRYNYIYPGHDNED